MKSKTIYYIVFLIAFTSFFLCGSKISYAQFGNATEPTQIGNNVILTISQSIQSVLSKAQETFNKWKKEMDDIASTFDGVKNFAKWQIEVVRLQEDFINLCSLEKEYFSRVATRYQSLLSQSTDMFKDIKYQKFEPGRMHFADYYDNLRQRSNYIYQDATCYAVKDIFREFDEINLAFGASLDALSTYVSKSQMTIKEKIEYLKDCKKRVRLALQKVKDKIYEDYQVDHKIKKALVISENLNIATSSEVAQIGNLARHEVASKVVMQKRSDARGKGYVAPTQATGVSDILSHNTSSSEETENNIVYKSYFSGLSGLILAIIYLMGFIACAWGFVIFIRGQRGVGGGGMSDPAFLVRIGIILIFGGSMVNFFLSMM